MTLPRPWGGSPAAGFDRRVRGVHPSFDRQMDLAVQTLIGINANPCISQDDGADLVVGGAESKGEHDTLLEQRFERLNEFHVDSFVLRSPG